MKKTVSILIACVLALSLVLASCSNDGGGGAANTPAGGGQSGEPSATQPGGDPGGGDYEYPKLKLSLSTPSAEDTGKSYDCRLFIDKVTQASGGNITFTEYFNAALAKPTQNLDAIGSGIADCGTVVNLYTPSQLPLSQISYPMPFGPTDGQMISDIMTQLSEKHPEFYQEYEKNNVHVLAYKGNESYKIYSSTPITSIAELHGRKIGMGGVYYIPWFQAAGAVPVNMPGGDAYQAVKTGVIEGEFVYDSFAYEYKWYEVMGYIYDVQMGTRNNDVLCINLDVWNSLDAETQALLETCAEEAYQEFHEWESAKCAEWNQLLKDNGMTETVITEEEKADWAEQALSQTDTIQQWIDDVTALGYDGAQFMRDYFSIAESLGWEWVFDTSKY